MQLVLYLLGLAVSLVAGVLLGYLLRRRKRISLDKTTFIIIIVLIFSLGFSIGSSSELLDALPRVGLNALVITLLAIGFSIVLVKLVGKVAKLE